MAGEEGQNMINFVSSATGEEERRPENQPAVQSETNQPQTNEAENSRKRKLKVVKTEAPEAAVMPRPAGLPKGLILPAPDRVFPPQHDLPPPPGFAYSPPPNPTATEASEAPVMPPPAGVPKGLILPAPDCIFPPQHDLPPPPGFAYRPPPSHTANLLSTMESPATSNTSLPASGHDQDYYPAHVREQIDNLEKLIAKQAEMLRQATKDVLRREYIVAEMEEKQKAAPILNAKESELNKLKLKHQEMVERELELQSQNLELQQKVTFLEERAVSLKAQLQEAMERWRKAELAAEGSVVNGGEVDKENEDSPDLHP